MVSDEKFLQLTLTSDYGARLNVTTVPYLSYYKDLGCFVINLLNNKTVILLNLAEYRLILADEAVGLVG